MNILLEDMPTSLYVKGHCIPIYTDFRDIIEIYISIVNGETEETLNLTFGLIKSEDDFVYAYENPTEFMEGFNNFLNMEEEQEEGSGGTSKRQVLSYETDAPYIVGAFRECYGINLLEIKYMHWYEFNALMLALNEKTELKRRMMYRGMDASKIKDKEEKKRILKIQRDIAIKQTVLSDSDIGDAFM